MENCFLLFLAPLDSTEIIFQMPKGHAFFISTHCAVSSKSLNQVTKRAPLELKQILCTASILQWSRSSVVDRVLNTTINNVSTESQKVYYCCKFIPESFIRPGISLCFGTHITWNLWPLTCLFIRHTQRHSSFFSGTKNSTPVNYTKWYENLLQVILATQPTS